MRFWDKYSIIIGWQNSCLTWDEFGVCISWFDYMRLNNTSGECEFCPDGEFYIKPTDTWESCGTSWVTYWAYRDECFYCPVGDFYDIDAEDWVSSWDTVTQIVLNGTETGEKAFWRGFDYYVNPKSGEVVELGSQKYPYKSLTLVFVELLNFLNHQDITVNVFVMEGTTNYLQEGQNYIINTTQVNLLTYSGSNSVPGYATIMWTDASLTLLDLKTKFNLLKNTTINFRIAVSATSLVFAFSRNSIFAFRTAVTVSNFNIYSEYSDISVSNIFIFPTGQNGKLLIFN